MHASIIACRFLRRVELLLHYAPAVAIRSSSQKLITGQEGLLLPDLTSGSYLIGKPLLLRDTAQGHESALKCQKARPMRTEPFSLPHTFETLAGFQQLFG